MKLFIAILLVTSSVSVLALDPFLKRSSGDKCYYDDGSVINNGGRICPQQLNIDTFNQRKRMTLPPVDLKMSQESIDWRLNFGKGLAAKGMRQGDQSLIPELLRLQKEHPDSARVLHSDAFLKWVAEDKARQRIYKNATHRKNPNLGSLEILLVTYKGWPWITNPAFLSHAKQSSLLLTLLKRADGGDISATKELVREAKAFATN